MELPKKLGAPKKIESPEKLWELAQEYFSWVDANPWLKNELIKSGELAGVTVPVRTQQPYTWSGLEVFCFKKGYNTRLDEYKSNRRGGYEDFTDIIQLISKILYEQKFAGASVGAFNANIISADLGLAAKTIIEDHTKEDFDYDDLSLEALEEIEAARLRKKENG